MDGEDPEYRRNTKLTLAQGEIPVLCFCKPLKKSEYFPGDPHREPPAVEKRQEERKGMDFRGRAERAAEYVRRRRPSVNKGPRMNVRSEEGAECAKPGGTAG